MWFVRALVVLVDLVTDGWIGSGGSRFCARYVNPAAKVIVHFHEPLHLFGFLSDKSPVAFGPLSGNKEGP